jgi:hypothetical protein
VYNFAPYLQRVLDVRFTVKKYPSISEAPSGNGASNDPICHSQEWQGYRNEIVRELGRCGIDLALGMALPLRTRFRRLWPVSGAADDGATTPTYGTSEAGGRVASPSNSIVLSVARIGGVGILRGELQLPVYFSQKVPRLLRVLVHIVSVVFLRD